MKLSIPNPLVQMSVTRFEIKHVDPTMISNGQCYHHMILI